MISPREHDASFDRVPEIPESDEDDSHDFRSTVLGVLGLLGLILILCVALAMTVALEAVFQSVRHLL